MKIFKWPRTVMMVLASFLVTTGGTFAGPVGTSHDQAKECAKHGGIWSLLPKRNVLCQYTEGGKPLLLPCGGCYHPNNVDCMIVGGTWVPASKTPPPFAYCLLPNNGGLQTSIPGEGNPSSLVGLDCSRYGLVPNGSGGCTRPGGGAPCDASKENCLAEGARQITGKVTRVDTKAKTFTMMAEEKAMTFAAATLKAGLPKVGAMIDVTYTQAKGGQLSATTFRYSQSSEQ